MSSTIAELECAQVPAAAMGRLASLRCARDLTVALHQRDLWLRWPRGDDDVPRMLLVIRGCRLYRLRDGHWYALGEAAPAFHVPDRLSFQPLWQVIFPAPFEAIPPTSFTPSAQTLTLVTDDHHRPTSALQCVLEAFLAWAGDVPPVVLAKMRGAALGRRLFVLGKNLPWFEDSERFWGRTVLVPLGQRPSPLLGEPDLRRACGCAEADLMILRPDRVEVVNQDLFTSLSHAALRLTAREIAT